MSRERIMWIVALLLVAGIGFYSGQTFDRRGGGFGGAAGRGGATTAGTVSTVAGNIVTITTRAGQTMQVQLDANSALRKQVDAQIGDITVGEQIVVTGTANGATIQASSVQIGGAGGRLGGAANPAATPAQ
jgi:YD repeat-containing protein